MGECLDTGAESAIMKLYEINNKALFRGRNKDKADAETTITTEWVGTSRRCSHLSALPARKPTRSEGMVFLFTQNQLEKEQ